MTYMCVAGRIVGDEDCCRDGRHPPADYPSQPVPRSAACSSWDGLLVLFCHDKKELRYARGIGKDTL